MWIFPTLLEHSVIPFKTKGTRVSVSGNLVYINHLWNQELCLKSMIG